MTYDEWLKQGLDSGWVGPPVCATHDGVPMSAEEEACEEPCVFVMRCYGSLEEKEEVEQNHSPSLWRKPPTDKAGHQPIIVQPDEIK